MHLHQLSDGRKMPIRLFHFVVGRIDDGFHGIEIEVDQALNVGKIKRKSCDGVGKPYPSLHLDLGNSSNCFPSRD